MKPQIIEKLRAQLSAGITTEVQVVYVLVGLRKLLEWDELKDDYPALAFHADWAVHVKMDRKAAKAILEKFEKANMHFRQGTRLQDLPPSLRREMERISSMESFEEEFTGCLEHYQLPPLTLHRPDGWSHFLHLYGRVVEDCPLIAKAGTDGAIEKVTVQLEMARETIRHEDGEEMLYKVKWLIQERDGKIGELFVINGFSLQNPQTTD